MTKYISNPDNLKLMMNMLKEKSRNIQFEAFHVFKVTRISFKIHNEMTSFLNKFVLTNTLYHLQVFVANPNKPKPILDILLRNQEKLIDFLTKFHADRSEDEQFNDEKAYLIKQIRELKSIGASSGGAGSSSSGGDTNSNATTPTTPPGHSKEGSITEGYTAFKWNN